MNKNNVLFVVPSNDGEAVEIQKLLSAHSVDFLKTSQGWGASWDGLEEHIKNKINMFYGSVYGVELQGKLNDRVINIDHHKYENDDRSNDLSSLEQVAKIINVPLNSYQKAVSLNDKGFIPLMESENVSPEMIKAVRLQDRTAQGITPEQEAQAEESCKQAVIHEDMTIVHCQHSKTACITDRLYNKYKNLLIISEDGERNFFGDGKICLNLQAKFGGWSGGQLPASGYWGGYPKEDELYSFLDI